MQTDIPEPKFTVLLPPDITQTVKAEVKDSLAYRKIQGAIQPYRQRWLDKARDEHALYYHNIHNRLGYAREKCAEIDERLNELYALNIGEEITPEIRKLESLRRPHATVSRALPTRFSSQEAYLEFVTPKIEEDFTQTLAELAERAEELQLDGEKMNVSCVAIKNNSITLSFQQEGQLGFDAVIFYSKASSILRLPHIRCNVTERKLGRALDFRPEEKINNGQYKPLRQKLSDALEQVDAELYEIYAESNAQYYETIHKKLPFARKRYSELKSEVGKLIGFHNPKAKSLKKVMNQFGNLVHSEAAAHESLDTYMLQVRQDWLRQNEKTYETITNKVNEAGMNTDTTKIRRLSMTTNGFEMTLTDDKGARMDLQLSITGGKGVQRPPLVNVKVSDVMLSQSLRAPFEQQKARLFSLKETKTEENSQAAKIPNGLITQAKIVEYKSKLYVTCHIAGVRQSPVPIIPEEWMKYISSPGNDKTSLAIAHYPKEIARAMDASNDYQETNKSQLTWHR